MSTPHKKEPNLMDMATMKELLMPHHSLNSEYFYLNDEIGILHGNPKLFRLVIQQKAPFIINDHRLAFILQGEATININLVNRHVSGGMIVYLAPGAIINPLSYSEDFELYGIALFPDFTLPFPPNQIPSAFNGSIRDFQFSVTEQDLLTARHILGTLWHLVQQPDYPRPVASSLVAALMHHYSALYQQHTEQHRSGYSREQTVFDRFIQLVNQHCTEQHKIGYYADRMNLTERYLCTVVRQTSGVTAKEWIDRALVTRIKVELMHTNKSVARIADDLHFPNPSFFSKYFRRIVGMTPGEYRASRP